MATENIAQVHEKVKDLPDEILVQLAQKGAGIDSTLAVAELDARNMMRQQSALQPPGPMGTVADEVIAESQMMQPGLTSVMPPIDANPMLAQGISSPMGAMAPPMGRMDARVAGLPVDDTMYAALGGIVPAVSYLSRFLPSIGRTLIKGAESSGIKGSLARALGLRVGKKRGAETLKGITTTVAKDPKNMMAGIGPYSMSVNPKAIQKAVGKRAMKRGLPALAAASIPFLGPGEVTRPKVNLEDYLKDPTPKLREPDPTPEAPPPIFGRRFWETVARAGVYGAADTEAPTFLTGLTGGLKQATEEDLVLRKEQQEQLAALGLQKVKTEGTLVQDLLKYGRENPTKMLKARVDFEKARLPEITMAVDAELSGAEWDRAGALDGLSGAQLKQRVVQERLDRAWNALLQQQGIPSLGGVSPEQQREELMINELLETIDSDKEFDEEAFHKAPKEVQDALIAQVLGS